MPRLIESLELLARLIHPELLREIDLAEYWQRLFFREPEA